MFRIEPMWLTRLPLSEVGGWQIVAGYELFFREAREDFEYEIPHILRSSGIIEWQRLQHHWYKLVLQTPDGAEHELRPTGNHEMYSGFGPSPSVSLGAF